MRSPATAADPISSTDARDTAFDVDFRLLRNVHLHYNYDLSDTGNDTGVVTTSTPSGNITTTTGGTTGVTTGSGGTVVTGRYALLAAQGFFTRDVTGNRHRDGPR